MDSEKRKKRTADWTAPIKFHQRGSGRLFHAETEEEKRVLERKNITGKTNDMALFSAALNGQVLTGKLTGVNNVDGKIQAIVTYKSPNTNRTYFVHIDEEKFITHQAASTRELKEKYFKMRLDSEIDFILIEKIDDATGKPFSLEAQINAGRLFGDRVTAAEIKRRQYWFAKNTVGGREEDYMFPGKICNARIVYVAKTKLVIEVGGAESVVPASEISWNPEPNIRHRYHVGEKVEVKLLSIKRDEENHKIQYIASVKQCIPDPMEDSIKNCTVGMVVKGTVGRLGEDRRSDGSVRVYAIIRCGDSLRIRCDLRAIQVALDDKVTVKINGIDYERLRVFGNIEHVDRDFRKL